MEHITQKLYSEKKLFADKKDEELEKRAHEVLHLGPRAQLIADERGKHREETRKIIYGELVHEVQAHGNTHESPHAVAEHASAAVKQRRRSSIATSAAPANLRRRSSINFVPMVVPTEKSENPLQAEEKGEPQIDEQIEAELQEQALKGAHEIEEEEEEEGLSPLEVFLLSVLLFSLFFPDVWDYSAVAEQKDIIRNVVLIICFVIFSGEISMLIKEEVGYFGSVFFYLDVVGTLAIVLDLSWIINLMTTGSSSATILRATRAAKLGIRSKEIFKLFASSFRILRIIRPFFVLAERVITKYFTFFGTRTEVKVEKKEKKHYTESQLKVLDWVDGKEAEITEAFAFRIAAVVMCLVIGIPFLQTTVIDNSPTAWITNMKMTGKNNQTTLADVNTLARKMDNYYKPKPDDLYSMSFESPYINGSYNYYPIDYYVRDDNLAEWYSSYSIQNSVLLSSSNPYAASYVQNKSCITCKTTFNVNLYLDVTADTESDALFSMMSTLLVIFVLFFGTSTLTAICKELIIEPLKEALLKSVGDEVPEELETNHRPSSNRLSTEQRRPFASGKELELQEFTKTTE